MDIFKSVFSKKDNLERFSKYFVSLYREGCKGQLEEILKDLENRLLEAKLEEE